METFKATKYANSGGTNTFKKTKYASYDSMVVRDWQNQNQSSIDAINKYNERIKAGEWLSNEDRAAYKSAIDTYTSTGNSLREVARHYGTIYTDDEEKSWQDSISSLNSGYVQVNDYYTKFGEEMERERKNAGWLKKGAFDDGWQAGDSIKTGIASINDLRQNFWTGLLGIGEKTVDALAHLGQVYNDQMAGQNAQSIMAFSALTGQDPADKLAIHNQAQAVAQKGTSEFIAKDLYDEEKLAKAIDISPEALLGKAIGVGEDESVFGEKSDSLVQSMGQMGGQIALQAVGVPWYVTTGLTSFGSESENALNQGASFHQAGTSALISAGAEVLSEKLFGGSALGETGLIPVDKITTGISNKILKSLLDYGIDLGTEGFEEVFSSIASRAASSLYKEDNMWELISNEEAIDEYVDSLVGGVIMSGLTNTGNLVQSVRTKTDYHTGLTKLGETNVNQIYNDTVAKIEAQGDELSKVDKQVLRETLTEVYKQDHGEIVAELKEKGEKKRISKLYSDADVAMKKELGGELNEDETKQYDKLSFNDTVGTQLVKDVAQEKMSNLPGFTEEAANVMTKGYDGAVPASKYIDVFDKAYKLGESGAVTTEVVNLAHNNQGIKQSTLLAAYDLGRQASENSVLQTAKQSDIINTESEALTNEGTSEGSGIHLRRGSERNDGSYSEEQVQGLESRPGTNQSRREGIRPADGEAINLVNEGREVRVADLGVLNGSKTQTVRLVDSNKETKAMKKARRDAESRGLKIKFFAGDNIVITEKTGEISSVKGYVLGDTMLVRADHPVYTADQIERHEAGHVRIERGEVDVKAVRKRLEEIVGAEAVESVAESYADLYAGTGMTAQEIWEECICDFLGDMNIFAKNANGALVVNELIKQTQAIVKEQKAEPNQTRGSPEAAQTKGKTQNTSESKIISHLKKAFQQVIFTDGGKAYVSDGFSILAVSSDTLKEIKNAIPDMKQVEFPAHIKKTFENKSIVTEAPKQYKGEGKQVYEFENDKAHGYYNKKLVGLIDGKTFYLENKKLNPTLFAVDKNGELYGAVLPLNARKQENVARTIEDTLTDPTPSKLKSFSKKQTDGKASRETEIMENNRYERLRTFKNDLPKVWFAYSYDYFYVYANNSFSDYEVIKKIRLDDKNTQLIDAIERRLKDDVNSNAGTFDRWVKSFQSRKRSNNWNFGNASGGTSTNRIDGMDGQQRGSESQPNSQTSNGDSKLKGKASRELDTEYLNAVERGDTDTAQRMVDEVAKNAGYTIKAYHGTARGDRVGNVFLPERATSGPMAFFTDNKNIADHYARNKSDTSLAYDTEYDSYYTQFRVNHNGKSISIPELWYQLSLSEKSKIMQRAQHITFDENSENIVYDSNAKHGLGGLDSYRINSNKGNYLRALVEEWLEDGNLYNEEQRFLDVLKLVGIDNVEYRDPQMRYEKTYDTWLRIYSPFDTDNVNQSFYDGLSEWIKDNDMYVYERESSNADLWDKNNQTPESWLDKLSYDMENNTTHAWTVIPDFVTDYLKTQGYDGIKDKGGKNGGAGHTVWIPFSSEQIKSADPVTYDDDGNVIPLSERFNPENNDIRYSRELDALDYITPEDEFEAVDEMAFSNRELLANALLDTVTTSEEYKLIRSYQEEIAQLDKSDKRLAQLKKDRNQLYKQEKPNFEAIRELNEKIKALEGEIVTRDKRLLRLESTTALKNVLDRARKDAYAKAMQKGKETMHRAVERRYKTIERNKAKETAHELQMLLNKNDKKRNVKLGEQAIVRAALDLSDMYFVTDDDLIMNGIQTLALDRENDAMAQYRVLYERLHATDDDVTNHKEERAQLRHDMNEVKKGLRDLLERERRRINNTKASSVYAVVINEYEKLQTSPDTHVSKAFDENVLAHLNKLKTDLGDKLISDMTLEELKDVNKAFAMIKHMVVNSNKMFREGRTEDIQERSTRIMQEFWGGGKERRDRRKNVAKVLNSIDKFGWNNLRPVDAFELIGSEGLTELFWDAVSAQDVYARDVVEYAEKLEKSRIKHGYKNWEFKPVTTFKTVDGRELKLTLGEMMSIYAYSKRAQADEHLRIGGIQFKKNAIYKDKEGVERERSRKALTYNITDDLRLEIISKLTQEQKAYVDDMQQLLTDWGQKGNEVTRILYGIDLFTEEHYFPLRSSHDYLQSANTQLGQTVTTASLVGSGFAKSTTPHANNPIILDSFDTVVHDHIDKMSKYHAYVIPIENLRKILDAQVTDDSNKIIALKAKIGERLGDGAEKYLEQYITDLNGSQQHGYDNGLMGLFGKAKGVQVAANLSVWVQQYFSVIRAMNEINPKYFASFIGEKYTQPDMKLYDEMKKYAPITVIKEMGGFDVGSHGSVANYVGFNEAGLSKEKVSKKMQDAFGVGANAMDKLGWMTIWKAIKKEVAETGQYKLGSEEFYKACGKRMNEVITKTQVYDSVNARSGYMRRKSDFAKMMTSFMGEPTVIVGTAEVDIVKTLRAMASKDKKAISNAWGKLIGTMVTLSISTAMTSIAKSLIYAMRDDDEDETYAEKYAEALAGAFRDDIKLMNYYPVARDIRAIIDGYDVERPDMTLIEDVINATKKFMEKKEDEPKRHTVEESINLIGTVGNLFRIPLKNIARDLRGLYNTIDNINNGYKTNIKDAIGEGWSGKENTKLYNLYIAELRGDTNRINYYKSTYKDDEDNSKYYSALRKAIRENDERVKTAATARLEGDNDTYYNLMYDVIEEGHFDSKLIRQAFEAEYNAQYKKREEAENEDEDG